MKRTLLNCHFQLLCIQIIIFVSDSATASFLRLKLKHKMFTRLCARAPCRLIIWIFVFMHAFVWINWHQSWRVRAHITWNHTNKNTNTLHLINIERNIQFNWIWLDSIRSDVNELHFDPQVSFYYNFFRHSDSIEWSTNVRNRAWFTLVELLEIYWNFKKIFIDRKSFYSSKHSDAIPYYPFLEVVILNRI